MNNALPPLLPILTSSSRSPQARGKAAYALSSILKHWPLAAPLLAADSSAGYIAIRDALAAQGQAAQVKRKLAFLVNTLTLQDGQKYEGEIPGEVRDVVEAHAKATGEGKTEGLVQGLRENRVYAVLVKSLQGTEGEGDVEYEENAIRAVSLAATKGGLTAAEKESVKRVWSAWGAKGQEERGLVGGDAKEIETRLA